MSSSLSLNPVKNAPIFWGAFAGSLLLFSLIRLLPVAQIYMPVSEGVALDRGFAAQLGADWNAYSPLAGEAQTFGPRVLIRYGLALGSRIFGSFERAGVWLSLLGIVATLAGVCKLARTVFACREFVVLSGLTAAAASALQGAWSADPTLAVGSALTVWSLYFFLSGLEMNLPHRIFPCTLLLGLAAYIRIELALLWIPMALYLLVSAATPSPAREKGVPLISMAMGGLLQLALILWPLIDRNLVLTGSSPVLPGFDAERVLGVAGTQGAFSHLGRFKDGFSLLMLDAGGLGIFLGLLWPVGLVLIHLRFRESAIPFVWAAILLPFLLMLTAISPLFGLQGFQESLRILSPMLIPVAVYPLTFLFFHVLDMKELPKKHVTGIWAALAAFAVLLALLPTLNHLTRRTRTYESTGDEALLEWFEGEPRLRNASLLTDRPGLFLSNGKDQVYGLHGETDWRLLGLRKADGSIDAARLNEYLRQKEIRLLHLASIDNPIADQMLAESNAPVLRPATVTPPHRVYLLQWSEPSGRN